MASDAQDSRQKHRLSPTSDDKDEAEKSSKRHKHRHHHHRHRHRHGSKKREEKSEQGGEDIILPPIQHVPSSHADDDVEEGEILEEEGLGGSDHQNLGDCKSGEIEHDSSLPVEESIGKNGRNSGAVRNDPSDDDLATNSVLDKGDKLKTRSLIGNKNNDDDDFSRNSIVDLRGEIFSRMSPERHANGHVGFESHKEENGQHREYGSPSKGSAKRKRYNDEPFDADDDKLRNERKSLSYERTGDKDITLVSSPSRDRYGDDAYNRSRSRSLDRARERSHSISIIEGGAILKRRCNHETDSPYYADRNKTLHDSDDERVIHNLDRQHGSKDLVRDGGREHSTSYRIYVEREERHHSRETRVRERSRERHVDKERREERERSWDWRRDMERERSRDRELVKDMRRETEREQSRDREVDRDRKRGKERDRSRDRAKATNREKERVKDRDRDRDRVRDWKSERDRARERERRSDGNKDKGRDIQRGREKYGNLEDGHGDRDRYTNSRHLRHDEKEYHHERTKKSDSVKVHSSKNDSLEGAEEKSKRDEDEPEELEEGIALHLAEQEEEDLNRIKVESRRRRQAILEKYKSQQLQQQIEPHSEAVKKDKDSVENFSQLGANVVPGVAVGRNDGSDAYDAAPSFSVGKSPPQNGIASSEKIGARGLGEGTPKSERSDDMFSDDIFGESPAGVRKSGKADVPRIERSGLHDNWDDAEGYYSYRFGEILDGRYEVIAAHGKGVFSMVVRAKNIKAGNGEPEEVAIKIIRNNDTMYKAGQEELVILKKLVGADPENKRHCVRFLSSFKYRNHLCLVFESLHMNLREVLKKFGRNIGLKLTAVRAYAKQLFMSLKHLRNCGVLHCDIKPDNMLVNEAKNVLKLCDFGNAMFAGKNDITPYLVSRFYRAPEIILGLPYDHPIDMWSVGCCLYELYTGKVLFPGPTNNDMLRLHMELKGPFPKKMLKKGGFIDQHFDQDLNFHATEEDPVTKKTIKRLFLNVKPKDIGSIIKGSSGEDPKMLANFKDMLEKIFVLDPDKRLTVSQALNHPFITGK